MLLDWWPPGRFEAEADGAEGTVHVTGHLAWFERWGHVGDEVRWHGDGWERSGTLVATGEHEVSVALYGSGARDGLEDRRGPSVRKRHRTPGHLLS